MKTYQDIEFMTSGKVSPLATPTAENEAVNKEYVDSVVLDLTSGEIIPKIAQYASADTAKGTIEERLTSLGFKAGVIIDPILWENVIYLKRQGNYVIGQWWTSFHEDNGGEFTVTIPENFRPKEITKLLECYVKPTTQSGLHIGSELAATAFPSGELVITYPVDGFFGDDNSHIDGRISWLSFGYEAPPIE